jgi:hypothetical protein
VVAAMNIDQETYDDASRLLILDVLCQTARPSPWFVPTVEQLHEYQQMQNDYLKLSLRLKRKYQQPIKPLPLP